MEGRGMPPTTVHCAAGFHPSNVFSIIVIHNVWVIYAWLICIILSNPSPVRSRSLLSVENQQNFHQAACDWFSDIFMRGSRAGRPTPAPAPAPESFQEGQGAWEMWDDLDLDGGRRGDEGGGESQVMNSGLCDSLPSWFQANDTQNAFVSDSR